MTTANLTLHKILLWFCLLLFVILVIKIKTKEPNPAVWYHVDFIQYGRERSVSYMLRDESDIILEYGDYATCMIAKVPEGMISKIVELECGVDRILNIKRHELKQN